MDDKTDRLAQEMDATRLYAPDLEAPRDEDALLAQELSDQYSDIIGRSSLFWNQQYRLVRKIGEGGQGTVFLAERSGAFGVHFPLALKFHRPDDYKVASIYQSEMARLAAVTMDVSRIQQDQLLDVYNVVEHEGILVLATEWVDGVDLRRLLAPELLERLNKKVSKDRWNYINDVVITSAGFQSRMMPSVVMGILRECLAGLSALHRQNILHGDMKPANVMVKQTGNCKIIDLGSSFSIDSPPERPTWTRRYAPIEVLQGDPHSPQSDLASLGYVVLELLTGTVPFLGINETSELIKAKQDIWKRIPELLPDDVARNSTIVELISHMIAPNPADRFTSLEEAELAENGASAIERQLVKVDMDTIATHELRVLLQEAAGSMNGPEAA